MAKNKDFNNLEIGRFNMCKTCDCCTTGNKKCSSRVYAGYTDVQYNHLRKGECHGYIFNDESSEEDIFEQLIASNYGTFKKDDGKYVMTTFGGKTLSYNNAREGIIDWADYILAVYKDDNNAVDKWFVSYLKKLIAA